MFALLYTMSYYPYNDATSPNSNHLDMGSNGHLSAKSVYFT